MKPELDKVYVGNCLDVLRSFNDGCVDMCITSPPYWNLRDYSTTPVVWGGSADCEHKWYGSGENSSCVKCGAWQGSLGLEPHFNQYIDHLLMVFKEIKRVLKPTGSVYVNLGDTFSGSGVVDKPEWTHKETVGTPKKYKIEYPRKCMCNIPARFSVRMIDDLGYTQRNHIVWHKPNQLPSSVKDRFTMDWESLFFFTKQEKYFYQQQFEPWTDARKGDVDRAKYGHKKYNSKPKLGNESFPEAKVVGNPDKGRNARCVWRIPVANYKGAHTATFPPSLLELPIKASCPEDGVVLDPFMGSGTTAEVAKRLGRHYVGIEMNADFLPMVEERLSKVPQPPRVSLSDFNE